MSSSSSSSGVPVCSNGTAQDIFNMACTLLAVPASTIIAGLPSGGGENDQYAITSLNQFLLWITEGSSRFARLCVPIYDTAIVAPTYPGQPTVGPFTQIVSASGRVLHKPSSVAIAGNALDQSAVGYLRVPADWYPPATNGDPTAWADNDVAVALSRYTTTPPIQVYGYFEPAPIVSLTQCLDPSLDDFVKRGIACYVAWMAAQKAQDNQVLAARIPVWGNEWIGAVKEKYTRIVAADLSISALFLPAPIDAQIALIKQMTLRT